MNRGTKEKRRRVRLGVALALILAGLVIPVLASGDLLPMVFRPSLSGLRLMSSAHPVLLPMVFRPSLSGLRLMSSAHPVVDKIRVESQDDLPRHAYEVKGTVRELAESPEAFAPLGAAIRANIEADLVKYEIADKTTQKGYLGTLMTLDLIERNWESAVERSALIGELEEKPSAKLLNGLGLKARYAALQETGSDEITPEFRAVYRKDYAARVNALPWDVVQDDVQNIKSQLEMVSENLLFGVIQESLEPVVEKTGELSGALAGQVTGFHWMLNGGLALKDESLAVLNEVVKSHQVEKKDIWADRDVDLAAAEGLSPVTVAIWDTGVDVDVFGERVFVNEAEVVNGKDDDGNGFVDDRHGIAWDLHAHKTTGLLYPMDEATRPVGELEVDVKGLFDMRAAIDSPEAVALRQKFASVGPDNVKPLLEDLGRYSIYCHGTHVAGIATAGNPAATVLVCRLTADPRMVPEPPTIEDTERLASSFEETMAYFKKHDVRVVNMSWVIAASSFERDLEANGIGETPEERKVMGREMFEISKRGLYAAMKSAPEILFVGGAGNSDNDIEFDEFVPPMFDLPNLLIAGAVDQAGDPTSFTSFGPTVNVYSNGFEVDSYVPGGERMKLSGTSMASPNVANLAAKLIAIDPSLTPPEVIELILAGCDDRREGDQVLQVIHPKRSIELLRERHGEA